MTKTNVLIEFHIQDWDRINKIPGFVETWAYINAKDFIHRREMGMIETKDSRIRFLVNDPSVTLKFKGYNESA